METDVTNAQAVTDTLDNSADVLQYHCEMIVNHLAEKYLTPGLDGTPRRMAQALTELTSGRRVQIAELFTTFDNGDDLINYDQMIVVPDIEVFSLCEHHVLPFVGRAVVAYIPSDKIIGLSKIPRLVDALSRRLQVQERLTAQIALTLQEQWLMNARLHP